MTSAIIVVPCYREERRFPRQAFIDYLEQRLDVSLLLVDDGSDDATASVLGSLAAEYPDRVQMMSLPYNMGKAEAVRRGTVAALELNPRFVGYWDADLATPLSAIWKFAEILDAHPEAVAVFGARVQLLGRKIERSAVRHYLGRIFATAASIVLSLRVYDTQCGAKLFRTTAACRKAFATPFLSRWIFDVEILARLIQLHHAGELRHPSQVVIEYPLQEWADVAGSKVRPRDFLRAFLSLVRIYVRYGRSLRPSRASPRPRRSGTLGER